MNYAITFLGSLLLCVSAQAAGLSQLTLTMSTPGPDTYADGTPVLTGETYLLVYIKAGATFQGVQTDGRLVDSASNAIVAKSLAVEGAKCGYLPVQYPSDLYPAGGSWMIVLLDTRDASGTVGGLVAGIGTTAATSAASSESTSLNSVKATTASGELAALSVSSLSAAPANTPAPVITAVERQDGTASVRFKNFTRSALYEVQSTTDLTTGQWTAAAGGTRIQAASAAITTASDGASVLPVSVQVPTSDKVRFFRVIVPGSK